MFTKDDYETIERLAAQQIEALEQLSKPGEIRRLIAWHSGMIPERRDISAAKKAEHIGVIEGILADMATAGVPITWDQLLQLCRQPRAELDKLAGVVAGMAASKRRQPRPARRAAERAERKAARKRRG